MQPAGVLPVTKLQTCTSRPVGCGIINMGNSCYMSSVLQCLAALPPVKDALAEKNVGLHGFLPTFKSCPLSRRGQACTCCMVDFQLLRQILSSHTQAIRPNDIMANLQLFSKTLSKTRQEDAHEFLLALLDAVERDTKKGIVARGGHKGQRSLIEQLFCGQIRSQVKCLACGYCSNTYELVTTLSLDLQRVQTVEDSLAQFTAPEFLDGANKYKCDNCKRLVPARKGFTLHDEPNILVIHLKRFSALSLNKISRHISFKLRMSLANFSSAHVEQNGGANGLAIGQQPHSVYTLSGVLVHQGGSLHSGHYYAHVWDDRHQCWMCANDSYVHPVSQQEVLGDQAYMLFYTRQPELKPPAPVPGAAPDPASQPPPMPAAKSNGCTPGAQLPPRQSFPTNTPWPAPSDEDRTTTDSTATDSTATHHHPFIGPQLPPKAPPLTSQHAHAHAHTHPHAYVHANGGAHSGVCAGGSWPAQNGSSAGSVNSGVNGSVGGGTVSGVSGVGGTTVLGAKSMVAPTRLPPLRAIRKPAPQPQQQQPAQPSSSSLFDGLPQPRQMHTQQPHPLQQQQAQQQSTDGSTRPSPHSAKRAREEKDENGGGGAGVAGVSVQEGDGDEGNEGGGRGRLNPNCGSGLSSSSGVGQNPDPGEGEGSGREGERGRGVLKSGEDGRPQKMQKMRHMLDSVKEDLYAKFRACPEYMARCSEAFQLRQARGESREDVRRDHPAVRMEMRDSHPRGAMRDASDRLQADLPAFIW